MDPMPPIAPVDAPRSRLAGLHLAIPPWLVSMVIHLVAMIVLALAGVNSARRGGGSEGIVAEVSFSSGENTPKSGYDEDDPGAQAAFSTPAVAVSRSVATSLQDALNAPLPFDPMGSLPAAVAVAGTPGSAAVGAISARGSDQSGQGPGGRGASGGVGGKGHTSVFGIEGEGYKFAYVFDRSGSMGGVGRNALSAVKAELVRSLDDLKPTHQFLIIFYNERPVLFNPTGRVGKLAFASEQTKEAARRFIGSITADGGTRHEDALKQAIRLQPDVIFFLTDADEPRMSDYQLDQIHRLANGIVIHTIEFGLGPKGSDENFLVRLARQNEGRYLYVDITRLFPASVAGGQ